MWSRPFILLAIPTQIALCADPSECGCSVLGQVYSSHWKTIAAPETLTAYTIATVINTVADVTTTTTIVNETPEAFQPPPTNEAGTRVHTVTYVDEGQTHTTVIAYPTFFLLWSETIGIQGSFELTDDKGTHCEQGKNITVKGNPQPPDGTRAEPTDPSDPFGWGYNFEDSGAFGSGTVTEWLDLLPEDPSLPHAAFGGCAVGVVFPANPLFDAQWVVVATETTIFGGDEVVVSVDPTQQARPSSHGSTGDKDSQPGEQGSKPGEQVSKPGEQGSKPGGSGDEGGQGTPYPASGPSVSSEAGRALAVQGWWALLFLFQLQSVLAWAST